METIWGIENDRVYDAILDQLTGAVADYIEGTPVLREMPIEDMRDFQDTEEDVDDSWDRRKSPTVQRSSLLCRKS